MSYLSCLHKVLFTYSRLLQADLRSKCLHVANVSVVADQAASAYAAAVLFVESAMRIAVSQQCIASPVHAGAATDTDLFMLTGMK